MADNAAAVSEIVDFRSMVTVPRPGGEPERALVQVKAVDGLYPLFGAVGLAGGGDPRRGAGGAGRPAGAWPRTAC